MAKPGHIAIIRLSALGDVAMTIPVLRVFCNTYPNIKVTVVSKPFLKPLFDEFLNVQFYGAEVKGKHKGFKGVIKLAKELKNLKIDAIADLHNVLRSKIIRAYFFFKSIPTAKIDKGRSEKQLLTQPKNKKFKQLPTTFERYAEVFGKLNLPIDLGQHQFPKRKTLSPSLIPFKEKTYKKHIGIAPFAAFEGKMYPLDLMEQVIAELDKRGDIQIFLFGGGVSELEKLDSIAHKHKSVMNVSGALAFEEELSLISNLDAMLAMDSGNAHLAAIYNVPTITLWGVTHPYAGFYPFKQPRENALMADREKFPLIPTSIYGNKVPEGYQNAMRSISPATVVDKIYSILQ